MSNSPPNGSDRIFIGVVISAFIGVMGWFGATVSDNQVRLATIATNQQNHERLLLELKESYSQRDKKMSDFNNRLTILEQAK